MLKSLKTLVILVVVMLILLTAGCQRLDFTTQKKEMSSTTQPVSLSEVKTEKKENTIKNLICFKCHIYEHFIKEPQKGVFSHSLHTQFEYHCNQCHSFRVYKTMVINKDTCINCHGMIPKLKGASG